MEDVFPRLVGGGGCGTPRASRSSIDCLGWTIQQFMTRNTPVRMCLTLALTVVLRCGGIVSRGELGGTGAGGEGAAGAGIDSQNPGGGGSGWGNWGGESAGGGEDSELSGGMSSEGGGTTAVEAMVTIPAGTFMMGSDSGESNEAPVHSVSVDSFQLDVTEVTVAAYQDCVDDGECAAGEATDYDARCNTGVTGREHHPINCVDWEQASAYCEWRGKRLPSEEEWEYAARGRDARVYPWGDAQPDDSRLCWSGDLMARDQSCAVGEFSDGDSPFGVKDMAGNVWEWTASGYSENYASSRTDEFRVIRGGSWYSRRTAYERVAFRMSENPVFRMPDSGLRCAMDVVR
jgi:formylglycine-generating enzyme required for sulfatase activity